eukprot:2786369-Prymnesium_polylepis.1
MTKAGSERGAAAARTRTEATRGSAACGAGRTTVVTACVPRPGHQVNTALHATVHTVGVYTG